MTLTDCQLLSIVAQLGTFAAAAERLHITPSAVSHAVSGVEAECGFPLSSVCTIMVLRLEWESEHRAADGYFADVETARIIISTFPICIGNLAQ